MQSESTACKSAPWFQQLSASFVIPSTKVCPFFYQPALQSFVHFNMFLPREGSLILKIFERMESFLTKLAGKFLPVSITKVAKGDYYAFKYKERMRVTAIK